MSKKNPYFGKWRIIEMEMWDQDFVDLVSEGHFTFDTDGLGSFQFGAVEGQIAVPCYNQSFEYRRGKHARVSARLNSSFGC